MSNPREKCAPRVFALLADQRNLAVDSALVQALPELEPEVQPTALDLLIERGRERGLRALVAGFDRFDSQLQELVLSRVGRLYAAARLAVTDESLDARRSAIELIRRSGDAKLAYLLADSICTFNGVYAKKGMRPDLWGRWLCDGDWIPIPGHQKT